MKNTAKKLLAMLLALCMVVGMLAGCTGSTTPTDAPKTDDTKTGTEDTNSGEEEKQFTVAMLGGDFTSGMGLQLKKTLGYTADALGIKLMLVEMGQDQEAGVTATENAITAGANLILTGEPNYGIIEACDKAGVIFGICCNYYDDPNMLKRAMESPYFYGQIAEEDYNTMTDAMQTLYDSGSRKIAWISNPQGVSTTHDIRVKAIEDFVAAHSDMEVVASYRGLSEYTETLQQFMAVHPEIDGLTGTLGGEYFASALEGAGLAGTGKVKFAAFDLTDGSAMKNGDQVWMSTGQPNSFALAMILGYNLWLGKDILGEANAKDQVFQRPYLPIHGYEEYENYMELCEGDVPFYDADQVRALCVKFNPDVSFEDFKALESTYNIPSLVEYRNSKSN